MKKSNLTAAIIGLFSPIIVSAADLSVASDAGASSVHIRSLAASCAVCHGTNGNRAESSRDEKAAQLAGINREDFLAKMLAFKSGDRAATVMHRHAKGLSSQEITSLAEYFSTQVPHTPAYLPSQKLLADHAN